MMAEDKSAPPQARVFDVETNFQKAAKRPGGIKRDEAVKARSLGG